jgi:hypothetical protein
MTRIRSSGCDLETAILKLSALGDVVRCARFRMFLLRILKLLQYSQGFTEISKKDGKPQARSEDVGDSSPIKRSPLKSAGRLRVPLRYIVLNHDLF